MSTGHPYFDSMIQEPLVADDSHEATSAPEYFPQQAQFSPLSMVESYPEAFAPSIEPTLPPNFTPTNSIGTELAYENLMTSAYHEAVACCQSCREGGGCADEGLDASYFPEDNGFGPTFEQGHSGKRGDSSNLVESAYHEAVACCQSCREGSGCAEEPSYPGYTDLRSQQNNLPSSIFPPQEVETGFPPLLPPNPKNIWPLNDLDGNAHLNPSYYGGFKHIGYEPEIPWESPFLPWPDKRGLINWPNSDKRLDFVGQANQQALFSKGRTDGLKGVPIIPKTNIPIKTSPTAEAKTTKTVGVSRQNYLDTFYPKDLGVKVIGYDRGAGKVEYKNPREVLKTYLKRFSKESPQTYIGSYIAASNCLTGSDFEQLDPISIFPCSKFVETKGAPEPKCTIPLTKVYYPNPEKNRPFLDISTSDSRKCLIEALVKTAVDRRKELAPNDSQLKFLFLDNIHPIRPNGILKDTTIANQNNIDFLRGLKKGLNDEGIRFMVNIAEASSLGAFQKYHPQHVQNWLDVVDAVYMEHPLSPLASGFGHSCRRTIARFLNELNIYKRLLKRGKAVLWQSKTQGAAKVIGYWLAAIALMIRDPKDPLFVERSVWDPPRSKSFGTEWVDWPAEYQTLNTGGQIECQVGRLKQVTFDCPPLGVKEHSQVTNGGLFPPYSPLSPQIVLPGSHPKVKNLDEDEYRFFSLKRSFLNSKKQKETFVAQSITLKMPPVTQEQTRKDKFKLGFFQPGGTYTTLITSPNVQLITAPNVPFSQTDGHISTQFNWKDKFSKMDKDFVKDLKKGKVALHFLADGIYIKRVTQAEIIHYFVSIAYNSVRSFSIGKTNYLCPVRGNCNWF